MVSHDILCLLLNLRLNFCHFVEDLIQEDDSDDFCLFALIDHVALLRIEA